MGESEANTMQVGGQHYKSEFQHWDWILVVRLSYLAAQVTKYLARWRKKNGKEDVNKSGHFLIKFIEDEKKRHAEYIAETNRFITENEIPDEEACVFHALVKYKLGDMRYLDIAKAAIEDIKSKEE